MRLGRLIYMVDRTEFLYGELIRPKAEDIRRLQVHMQAKLGQGAGEAQFVLGIDRDGQRRGLSREDIETSLATLQSLATLLEAEVIVVSRTQEAQGEVVEVFVRKKDRGPVIMDVRLALLGDQGSGKSTLIGVLTRGKSDNGQGSARVCVHKHEEALKHTCSVSQHFLGFDTQGNVTNSRHSAWEEVAERSNKIITLLDLAGHEKYSRNLVWPLACEPQYAAVLIDATKGLTQVAQRHVQMVLGLNTPLIVLLNKTDLVATARIDDCIIQLSSFFADNHRILLRVASNEDVVLYSRTFGSEGIVPVFLVSLVTRSGLDSLTSFLNMVPVRGDWANSHTSFGTFYIERQYDIPNVGLILAGLVVKGTISRLQRLKLGPDNEGKFRMVQILSIHCQRVVVHTVHAGQLCSFHISLGKSAERWLHSQDLIRPGMVLVDPKASPGAALEFICELWPIDNEPTTRYMTEQYKPLIHTQTIRQCASLVLSATPDLQISSSKRTMVHFRFLYRSEFLEPGTKLLIKDTLMTAMGVIVQVFYMGREVH